MLAVRPDAQEVVKEFSFRLLKHHQARCKYITAIRFKVGDDI